MTFDYDFKETFPTQFEFVLSAPVKNRMMSMIFQKTRAGVEKTTGKDVSGASPELLERFEIDHRFLNLLGTSLHKPIKDVVRQVGEDGIKVLTNRIEQAWFERQPDRDWLVKIKVVGDFADER